ncbi:MAG: ATP-binding protein [Aquincola tertiaricarbonis]
MVEHPAASRGPRHRYLRSRLWLIVLAVATPLLVLLALSIRDERRQAEQRTYALLKQRSDVAAARVRDALEKAEHLLTFMASRQRLRLLDPEACESLMAGVAGSSAAYTNIGLFDASGTAVCTSAGHRGRTQFGQHPWFIAGMAADRVWLSDPLRGPLSGLWVVYMTLPVVDNAGIKVGLLAVSLDLQPLIESLASLATEPGHSVAIRKDRRVFLARHPEPARWVGQPVPHTLLTPGELPSAPVQVAIGVDGSRRAFALTRLPRFGLEAAAGMPAAQVYHEANAAALRGLGAAGLAIGLGLGAASLAARRLTMALSSVADTARRLHAGATDVRADVRLPGEFGEVALEFNRLMDRNQERAAQLLQSQRRAVRARRFYETLSATGQAIARQAPAQALFDEVCRACMDSGLASYAWITVKEGEQARVVTSRHAASVAQAIDIAKRWGGGHAQVTEQVLRQGRVLAERTPGWRPVAAVPLVVGQEQLGALTLFGPEEDAYDDDMLALLAELGREISLGLELDRHRQSRAALASAEAASRAKTTFLSHVSHELRTPLNAVLGFAQLCRSALDEGRPERLPDYLGHMLSAGHQLRRLIDDLMDVSRIESGEMTVEMADVDVMAKMANVAQLSEPAAAERHIGFHLDFSTDERLLVRTDPVRLRQVLLNLVSNAIKYNRPGGHVALSVRREADTVRLQVSDNGQGMSAAQLDKLFQAFNRMGREKTSIEGTGIGLFISKRLVEALGGELTVHSREGVGTTAMVLLPYVPPLQAEAPAAGAASTGPAHDGTRPLAGSVLYVEDNPVNAMLVEHWFARHPQVQLRVAETGAQGLCLAAELQPDVVLLDMQLPDLTGLEVIERLRGDARTARLRVIALSANAMPDDVDAALRAGVEAYWPKPIDFQQLDAGVARVLDEQRRRAAPAV